MEIHSSFRPCAFCGGRSNPKSLLKPTRGNFILISDKGNPWLSSWRKHSDSSQRPNFSTDLQALNEVFFLEGNAYPLYAYRPYGQITYHLQSAVISSSLKSVVTYMKIWFHGPNTSVFQAGTAQDQYGKCRFLQDYPALIRSAKLPVLICCSQA